MKEKHSRCQFKVIISLDRKNKNKMVIAYLDMIGFPAWHPQMDILFLINLILQLLLFVELSHFLVLMIKLVSSDSVVKKSFLWAHKNSAVASSNMRQFWFFSFLCLFCPSQTQKLFSLCVYVCVCVCDISWFNLTFKRSLVYRIWQELAPHADNRVFCHLFRCFLHFLYFASLLGCHDVFRKRCVVMTDCNAAGVKLKEVVKWGFTHKHTHRCKDITRLVSDLCLSLMPSSASFGTHTQIQMQCTCVHVVLLMYSTDQCVQIILANNFLLPVSSSVTSCSLGLVISDPSEETVIFRCHPLWDLLA